MEKVKKAKLIISGVLVLIVAIAIIIGQIRKRQNESTGAPAQKEKSAKGNSLEENLLAIKALKSYASDAQKRQKEIQDALGKLKNDTEQFKNQSVQSQQPEQSTVQSEQPVTTVQAVREMLIITAPEERNETKKIVIPAGSYAKCRLLHGFYAPVQYEYSVPAVLVVYGEIMTPAGDTISLPDSRIVCRVQGEANSERALLQGVSFSVESGKSSAQTNGYVVDDDGVLGAKGKYVYNATSEIVLKAIAGVARGIGQFSQYGIAGNVLAGRQNPQQAMAQFAEGGAISGAGQAVEGIAEKRASEFIPSVFVPEGGLVTYYFLSDTEISLPANKQRKEDETTFSIVDH